MPWREYLAQHCGNAAEPPPVTVTKGETRTLRGADASLHNMPKPSKQTDPRMTERAGNYTLEQYLFQGWTVEMLIAHGLAKPGTKEGTTP